MNTINVMRRLFLLGLLIITIPYINESYQKSILLVNAEIENNTNYSEIVYSRRFGGDNTEYNDINSVIDHQNNTILIGITADDDFPVVNAFDDTFNGGTYFDDDIFVSKLDNTGELKFSTYFGGSGDDWGYSIQTDSNNSIIIAGVTDSKDFPLKNAFQSEYFDNSKVWQDGFISKFNSDGILIWSSYVGGEGSEKIGDIAIDNDNNIILTGKTSGLPIINETTNSNSEDAFILKISSDGDIIWGRYIGGVDYDEVTRVVLDSNDDIIITGVTNSPNFPVKKSYENEFGKVERDAFIAKFDKDGELKISTFFGSGKGSDYIKDLVIDDQDNIYFTGRSNSKLPELIGNREDGSFISKFNSSLYPLWSIAIPSNSIAKISDYNRNQLVIGYSDYYRLGQNYSKLEYETETNVIQLISKEGQMGKIFTFSGDTNEITDLSVKFGNIIVTGNLINPLLYPLTIDNCDNGSYFITIFSSEIFNLVNTNIPSPRFVSFVKEENYVTVNWDIIIDATYIVDFAGSSDCEFIVIANSSDTSAIHRVGRYDQFVMFRVKAVIDGVEGLYSQLIIPFSVIILVENTRTPFKIYSLYFTILIILIFRKKMEIKL